MANMNAGQPWGTDDDETLKRMAKEGASARTIGDALKRTRNAVLGRAFRLSITLDGEPKPAGKPKLIRYGKPRKPYVVKRQLKPRPPKPVQVQVEEPTNLECTMGVGVTWDALGDNCCRWPKGDLFCGEPTEARRPYCTHHATRSQAPRMPKVLATVSRQHKRSPF